MFGIARAMGKAIKSRMGGSKPKTMAPLRTPVAGSNAQSKAYGKAMAGAMKNQKTFGVPGAK